MIQTAIGDAMDGNDPFEELKRLLRFVEGDK